MPPDGHRRCRAMHRAQVWVASNAAPLRRTETRDLLGLHSMARSTLGSLPAYAPVIFAVDRGRGEPGLPRRNTAPPRPALPRARRVCRPAARRTGTARGCCCTAPARAFGLPIGVPARHQQTGNVEGGIGAAARRGSQPAEHVARAWPRRPVPARPGPYACRAKKQPAEPLRHHAGA